MRILVTGAAGYIGGRMVDALLKKEWAERVIGTDIREMERCDEKFSFHAQDIREPLAGLMKKENIDAVVHTAYVLPPNHNKKLMEDINKGGTGNVLESSVQAGVQRILYTSSTTAYGFWPDNDRPLTEESPLRGNDDFIYAKNKKEIEKLIAGFKRSNPGIDVAVLRPCFVVGPGFNNPLAEHLQKDFVLLPSDHLPWQFVHEDDLIEIMLMALERPLTGVYNVAADGTITFPEMVRALGNIGIFLPSRIVFPLNELAWKLRLKWITKFPSPAMRMIINPWIASGEKLRRETGYRYKYGSSEAFMDFVASVATD